MIIRTIALGLILLAANTAIAQQLKGLILTSPGVYHNYEYQNRVIAEALASRVDVQFDVSLAELDRWKNTDFSEGYDVLIYNICMADDTNPELIANMRRQTEELGVPAMVLHCTMHSFRTTDLWWPFYGLQTKAHERLKAMTMEPANKHPILQGVPEQWTLAEDELYINLQLGEVLELQTSPGEDGAAHVITWLKAAAGTPVFGTTLGHADQTLEDPVYQRLLSNALLYITGNLSADGTPEPGALASNEGQPAIDQFSAADGIRYLGAEGKDCVMKEFAWAVGPCYLGCYLNPLVWGDEAEACRVECQKDLPSPEEATRACMPE